MSVVREKESGVYGKATKDAARKEASAPCEGRSTRKKNEEDRGRKDGACGQATRGVARVEKEFGGRVKEENKRTLWQRSTRENTPTRVRVVHGGSNSDVCEV